MFAFASRRLLFVLLLATGACTPAPEATTATDVAGADPGAAGGRAASEEASAEAVAMSADDPCRLLTTADVRAVFSGAEPGVRDRTREKYGISTCVWTTPGGVFAVQTWTADPGTLDDEIRGMSSGVLDPTIASSHESLRFENIAGVADSAEAYVEKRDEKRGILADVATLMAQRGNQILELQSTDLAKGDRDAALLALTQLGKAAAARM